MSQPEAFWYAQGRVSVPPIIGLGGIEMDNGGYNGSDLARAMTLKFVQPTAFGAISDRLISVSATYAFLDHATPLGQAFVSRPAGLSIVQAPIPGALALFASGLLGRGRM